MIPIRYLPSDKIHGVGASGDLEDGSLYGFSTSCDRPIEDLARWREEAGAAVDCTACLHAAERCGDAPARLTPTQRKVLEAMVEGGYIHVHAGIDPRMFPGSNPINADTFRALHNRSLIQTGDRHQSVWIISERGREAVRR